VHITGSNNPLGVTNSLDYSYFYPKYIIKDFFGICIIGGVLIIYLSTLNPFFINDPDNYIEANSLSTPKHITPE